MPAASDRPIAPLPELEVERVIDVLEQAGVDPHPDLRTVIGGSDPDEVANDILHHEVHDPSP